MISLSHFPQSVLQRLHLIERLNQSGNHLIIVEKRSRPIRSGRLLDHLQFSIPLIEGVAKSALYCARWTRPF